MATVTKKCFEYIKVEKCSYMYLRKSHVVMYASIVFLQSGLLGSCISGWKFETSFQLHSGVLYQKIINWKVLHSNENKLCKMTLPKYWDKI